MLERSAVAPHDPDKLALVETVGSVLWFVMDGFWMLNQAGPAKWMVVPTVCVNSLVFRYAKRTFSHVAVVAAMNSWLLMNVFWMLGDLDKDPRPLEWARRFFVLGICLLLVTVGREAIRRERLADVLSHFRRLRF